MTSIKKNMGFQLVYRVLTVITPLITSPWLSRALGAQSLGVFSATQAYVNYFTLFAVLGVENYGNRSIAAVQGDVLRRQKTFWNIYVIQFFATIASSLCYFASIPFLDAQRRLFYLLQGIWLLSYGMDINWFFFGIERFDLTVKRSIVVKLLTVVSIVMFVRSPADLPVYIIIMAGGNVLSQSFLWIYIWRFIGIERPKYIEIKKHIKPMFVLFIPILAGSVYHIMDKTMLDVFSDEISLGYYYSADKVINIPLGVITAVGTVMLPRISNMMGNANNGEIKDVIAKAVELTTFLTAGIGFGIAAIAEEYIPIFFGKGFEPCIVLIYWFIPVLIAKAWNNAIRAQYLIPAQKDRAFIIAVLAGAASNLVLNIVLIRLYGAVGAVVATFIAEAVVLFVEERSIKDEIPFIKFFGGNLIYLVFGIVMFVICRMVRTVLPSSNALCVVCLVATGTVVYMVQSVALWMYNTESVFNPMVSKVVQYICKKV